MPRKDKRKVSSQTAADELDTISGRVLNRKRQRNGHEHSATSVTNDHSPLKQRCACCESHTCSNSEMPPTRADGSFADHERASREYMVDPTPRSESTTVFQQLPQKRYGTVNMKGHASAHVGDRIIHDQSMHFGAGTVNLSRFEDQREVEDDVAQTLFLDSLSFSSMLDRERQIPQAHDSTFRWNEDLAYADLREWLRNPSSRLFWVKGKPGCGKSTFMKALAADPWLRAWVEMSETRKFVVATCFFWNAGDCWQKTHSGFLRSLLFDLLSADPESCELACHKRWRKLKARLDISDTWSDKELEDALINVLKKMQPDYMVLFLIDGLDEIEGNYRQYKGLTSFLHVINGLGVAKICTSSRPWPLFEDEFKTCPSITLEDHTQFDITKFVEQHFATSPSFQALQRSEPDKARELQLKICRKSEGVFLWVDLVTQELLRASQEGQTMSDLYQLLNTIPPDLYKYLGRIFDSIEAVHRKRASTMLLLALRTNDLYLPAFSFVQADRVLFEDLPREASEQLAMSQRLRRLVATVCKGMLQVKTNQSCRRLGTDAVVFLHRTARDFLLGSELQSMLQSQSLLDIDTDTFSIEALLKQLEALTPQDGHDLIDLTDSCLKHIFTAAHDSTSRVNRAAQLDRLESLLNKMAPVSDIPSLCDTPHPRRVKAALINWKSVQRPFELLTQIYGPISGKDHTSTTMASQEVATAAGTANASSVLTCPFAVKSFMDCWSGEGPCHCFPLHIDNRAYEVCLSWNDTKSAYLKQHLLRTHCFPEFSCPRCRLDCKNRVELEKHLQAREQCIQRPERYENDPLKITPELQEEFGLRARNKVKMDSVDYWLMIYERLFPGSQPPPSPVHALLWRHKPGTGGREYVQEVPDSLQPRIIPSPPVFHPHPPVFSLPVFSPARSSDFDAQGIYSFDFPSHDLYSYDVLYGEPHSVAV